jgi:hypothetical protein
VARRCSGTTYLDFFQHDRLKQQKGIIASTWRDYRD